MPTLAQQLRTNAFRSAHLAVRGRVVTTDTEETLTVVVQDMPEPLDPESGSVARAKGPVYTKVTAAVGDVTDPRAIETFTEADGGRVHKVNRYDETVADAVTREWTCEAQRIE